MLLLSDKEGGSHHRDGRADFRFAPSQWETALLCNDVSHWLGASLESALDHRQAKSMAEMCSYVQGINWYHNNGVTMSAVMSQITGMSTVCSVACSSAHQRKHQRSASLAFVRGNHRWPVDSPHKEPVTLKMFPYSDIIMNITIWKRFRIHGPLCWNPSVTKNPWCIALFFVRLNNLLNKQ